MEAPVVTDRIGVGHELWTADLGGDGDEELGVAWRDPGKRDFAKPGAGVCRASLLGTANFPIAG